MADFLKSNGSKRVNLAALLKEAWCQHGPGLLEEKILHLWPVETIVQSLPEVLQMCCDKAAFSGNSLCVHFFFVSFKHI